MKFLTEENERKTNALQKRLKEKEIMFYNDIVKEHQKSLGYKQEIDKLQEIIKAYSKTRDFQAIPTKLTPEFTLESKNYEQNIQELRGQPGRLQSFQHQILEEKELEINQIRKEYMDLLGQKNAVITEKERQNETLLEKIEDKERVISKLKSDEKIHEAGLRQHVDNLKKIVEVKTRSIEKLEGEIQVMKEEMNSQANKHLYEAKLEKEDILTLI